MGAHQALAGEKEIEETREKGSALFARREKETPLTRHF